MSNQRILSSLLFVSLGLLGACTEEPINAADGGGGEGTGGVLAGGAGEGGSGGAPPSPSDICEPLGIGAIAWTDGASGTRRGETAGDFQLPLLDGSTWSFAERFSGCETYLFLPDTLVVSDLDDTSIWERDLDDLVATSPENTHYFFVSRMTAADAETSLGGMQTRVDELLGTLTEEDAAWWKERLHVVAEPAADLDGWVADVLSGHGGAGFAIDRGQRIRGVGFLADVNRYSSMLQTAGAWPWKSNLAYAAHEAHYFNAQADTDARLASEDATVVTLWDGEVLEQFEEIDVTLPSAEEMAGFDTFEIEVELACPNPDVIEFGNCGAWDYLAWLSVRGPNDQNVEIARFITSYHRETRWVVDASPMLALLREGGDHHLRWDFAPEWNTQPTATRMELRFSNRGKKASPSVAVPLWTGGPFNSTYNASHLPVDVPIPADATKVLFYALVTGHGAAQMSCAEFCNHQHELAVGGTALLREFPEAGTEDQCIPQITEGMVPNQGGTWWFGRGGWCPGQQVKPWIEDVTDLVTPGEVATLSYRGLLGGQDPPDDSGDIVLSSYLVFH